jgi:hypothetical protein
MDTPPLRLHPRTCIASNKPLVEHIVSPCRGSQASLVANLRAHEYADFVSFLLLQINFLGRELCSSPPSESVPSTYPIKVPRAFPRPYPGLGSDLGDPPPGGGSSPRFVRAAQRRPRGGRTPPPPRFLRI